MVLITTITLGELKAFVKSEQYLSFTDVPISLARVTSYLNNPNGHKDDVVLYMAFIAEKLVGYRTVLADRFECNQKKQKFGWLSGNWVHPNYRRQHISTLLFDAVIKDWNENLLYTNYAEASKAVYDKTAAFTIFKTLKGKRFYQRICLTELLAPKSVFFSRIKPLLKVIDWTSNLLLDLRFQFKQQKNQFNHIEKIIGEDDEVTSFLMKFKTAELFKRDLKTYQWIQENPWLKTDVITERLSKKYYFSWYASSYEYSFYKILDKKTNVILAVIYYSIKNKQLKIPYLYATENAYDLVTNFVLELAIKNKINFATIYDEKLNEFIGNSRHLFLKQRNFEQNYMITKSLLTEYPNLKQYAIQTGDGDGVFT